jgi:hypothetical protein
MELRLLRRCDYSAAQIAEMSQEERAAAVQEAIEFGVYAGTLPSSPIEVVEAKGPIFFDVETGLPLTLEQMAKRGVCVYRFPDTIPLYPLFEKSSLKKALLKFQQNPTLDMADREHLKRLAADERLEEHWSYIVRCCKPKNPLAASAGQLIWHVLAARRAAEFVEDYPERQQHAQNAESLARFLKNKGQIDKQTYLLLKKLAHDLKEPEDLRPLNPAAIPVSRKARSTFEGHTTTNSRVLKAFMTWMSRHLRATYGQPLNDLVATLTDITFPEQETTIDRVRAAIKPTTRKGRSAK